MGWVSGVELTVAVSEAGALGTLALPGLRAAALVPLLDEIERRTAAPYAVSWLAPYADPAAVELAASRARVVELFWGDPDAGVVRRIHDGGALAGWQVGSLREARAAADAGCDLVTVQGVEAGGHVRGTEPLRALLEQVVPELDVPVVAAGGIATATAVRAVLDAGADAVRVGTALLATPEADVHPAYVEALLAAEADDSVLTGFFDDGWPDAPHRVLRSCLEAQDGLPPGPVGQVELAGQRRDLDRRSPVPPTRSATGSPQAMALYAGPSVGAVRKVRPAAEVVEELVGGWRA